MIGRQRDRPPAPSLPGRGALPHLQIGLGTVTRVEFYRNDGATLLGSDTTAPYSYNWKNVPSGTHALRVKAYDDRGAVTTSAAVSITVRSKN